MAFPHSTETDSKSIFKRCNLQAVTIKQRALPQTLYEQALLKLKGFVDDRACWRRKSASSFSTAADPGCQDVEDTCHDMLSFAHFRLLHCHTTCNCCSVVMKDFWVRCEEETIVALGKRAQRLRNYLQQVGTLTK